MTFNSASNWWEYVDTAPSTATELNCVFNNGSGTWDNNSGADWNFAVVANTTPQPPAQPQNLALTPVQTNQINLSWSAVLGADAYLVNRDGAPVEMAGSTTYADAGLSADSSHCYSVVASNAVGFSTPSVTLCTNTLAAAPTHYPAFLMDGVLDAPGFLLASNGLPLYAALRGRTLYVATASPGTAGPNDLFIFVSDQLLPGATAAAPWSKSGLVAVAANKPYLASESQNSYVSWYVNGAQANLPCAKSASSTGVLEGTIDLVQAFGSMPTNLFLCAAGYATANGGALALQCPAGSGPNIEANEFFVIPTTALWDANGNGVFDLLEPLMGFRLLELEPAAVGYALTWAAMPGRSYQVLYLDALAGGWGNLPGGSNAASALQLSLSYTDAPPAGATQRFYRVRLLP